MMISMVIVVCVVWVYLMVVRFMFVFGWTFW